MAVSRRKARESALRVLYSIDIGGMSVEDALSATLEESNLSDLQVEYTRTLVNGVADHVYEIDDLIMPLVKDYDYSRLAAIDRNLIRLGCYELYHQPAVPPAVSLDEAIEIAKKYSTPESGKFVNGVLAKLLAASPKATWNADLAPPEFEDAPEPEDPEIPAIEDVDIDADSPEAKKLARIGGWTLRVEDSE